jgi:hypothetical protein
MNALKNITGRLCLLIAIAVATATFVQTSTAKQGATDPIPGTSKGGTNSGGSGSGGGGGGGGGGSSTPAPTPTPTPVPTAPLPAPIAATLTFTDVSLLNGTAPNCSGSYNIDPYYPTLSLMTVHASLDSVNLMDGSYLYLQIRYANGTVYPFTSNALYVLGGIATGTYSAYIVPGTTIAGVDVCDALGNVILSGQ